MSDNTEKIFHVIDNSGEDFYVRANSFGEAEAKFKAWEKTNLDDPQLIAFGGYLIADEPKILKHISEHQNQNETSS
jgi:hypothetical protein